MESPVETLKVSVIVTHQLGINQPYLKACLAGLNETVDIGFEVVLVSGADYDPEPLVSGMRNTRAIWDPGLDTATKKVDHAFPLLNPETTHILLLSDDVIVSRHMIHDLYIAFLGGKQFILNPMSNSDLGGRYIADLFLTTYIVGIDLTKTKSLHPDMTIDDFKSSEIRSLMKFQRGPRDPFLIGMPWVSFYCTMIPKHVWSTVGGLDEALEYRFCDEDYCYRAARLGFPSMINLSTFAFHFGSRTLKVLKTPEVDAFALDHFRKKYTP